MAIGPPGKFPNSFLILIICVFSFLIFVSLFSIFQFFLLPIGIHLIVYQRFIQISTYEKIIFSKILLLNMNFPKLDSFIVCNVSLFPVTVLIAIAIAIAVAAAI